MVLHGSWSCSGLSHWLGMWHLMVKTVLFLLLISLWLQPIQVQVTGFEIVEKEDIYRSRPCPAFLMFEMAAYLSDMTFELPCHCKPEQANSVVWYFQKKLGSQHTKVLTDFNGTMDVNSKRMLSADILRRFSIRMFSLIVFQSRAQDSGHYICGSQEGQYYYGYDVDIQESKFASIEFLDEEMHPEPPYITKYFEVFTTFWEWTKCDRCDSRGEQRRLGMCYIKTAYLYPRYKVSELDTAPCGSASVPERFKKVIRDWVPEIVIRSCVVSCKVLVKGALNKAKQKLLEKIDDIRKKIPYLPKVPTQLHTQTMGTPLSLRCPGSRPEHAVAWDKGDYRMYRKDWLIMPNKTMRIYIDHGNHLCFRALRMSDKAIYYCWLQGKMRAGIRLSVTRNPKEQRSFTEPESIFAFKVIGYSFLLYTAIFTLCQCLRCFYHNFMCSPEFT
ncbi:Ig-like V-type domain-containing protein FAM187A [Discoglossus pictus]